MDSDRPAPPTNVRLVIILLTTLVAFLLYLDRICLGFMALYVSEELSLSDGQMGLVLSSFFLAYAIAQVPSGWLSDRYGARVMLTIYLAAWSVCTGLMGLAYGFVSLVLLRLGCGLFQAGAYPTSAGLIRRWVPAGRRGLTSGIVSIGGRLGGAFAPLLTAYLMVAFLSRDHSALLEPEDILANQWENLAGLLRDPPSKDTTPSKPLTPDEVEQEAARQGLLKRLRDALPGSLQTQVDRAGFAPVTEPLSAGERQELLAALNAALSRPDLLAGLNIRALSLPREARDYLTRGSGDLTEAEVQRRNRLVLETALPKIVRKFHGPGWRPVLILYGAAGILTALLFWWAFRDSPRQHPGVNPAELALIEGTPESSPQSAGPPQESAAPPPLPPLPWKAFLTHRSLWLMSAVQFLTNVSWVFLITWFPGYLAQEHRVPVEERGWMTFLPLFVGIAGMFLGGWLTDWATRRWGLKLGRQLPISGSRFLAGAAFLACLFMNAPWPIALAMAVVALATDLGTPAMWAYSLDVGGRNTGAVLGWGNMWGNLGGFVSPLLLQALNVQFGPDSMFLVCGLGFVLAGVLALGIDATRPLEPTLPEEPRTE